MSLKSFSILFIVLFIFSLNGIAQKKSFKLDYEKYKLKNGLEVILHQDKSDPITAVAIQYHVGSNREVPGKTGFAHLFEHMMFQESQNVGQDQFFKLIQGNGGTLNGGTWQDGTVYYEVVPNSALEMSLWLEADRMGFLLPTATYDAFLNQQEVVQNEKRQNYDNRPYGQTSYIISKLLYPEGHPYNWTTIGSLEDLQNATLKDVHDFYKKWYGPNNATLVVAGDFDVDKTKEWIEKYFGSIPASAPVQSIKPMRVTLDNQKRASYEDNFAQSPELTMLFPTVEQYTKDSYALDVLADLLGKGKKSPLYKVIVEEKKLAPSVSTNQNSNEIAGDFRIRIRAFPNVSLKDVEKAIFESFDKFEKDKFTEKDLERTKAGIETNFYNSISSVLGKAYTLAAYNIFAGSPDFLSQDLNNSLSVTLDDVWDVYNKYIKNKNYVLTSFVPKGKLDLAAENSPVFIIPGENLTPFTEEQKLEKRNLPENQVKVEKIKSDFDRSKIPALGPDPALKTPKVWNNKLNNGLKIYGIEQNELPLVDFQINIKGGMLLDDKNKIGVANLLAKMLMQGTKSKTPVELEEAIYNLGSRINVYATNESIALQANCLSSKFDETFKLAKEILFEPRWDEKEFERVKNEIIENINRNKTSAATTASNVFQKLVYGENNILSNDLMGTVESVNSITLNDIKNYYKNNFAPQITNIVIAGNITKDKAVDEFKSLLENWDKHDVKFPEIPAPEAPKTSVCYFIDFPGARQSEIRIGSVGPAFTDPDFFKATVMNYKLGGSFNGIVNMILREEKGYTYGARTYFSGTEYPGYFVASAGVQSNATLESAQIFKDEMNKYRNGVSAEDLDFTKNALIKSNALRFETLGALRGMLTQIAKYNLPIDYVIDQEKQIYGMTLDEHKELAQKFIQPDKMIYLIAGDKATQMDKLKELGFGDPILLNKDGNPVK